MEIRPNKTLGELHRRRKHASGPVQHDSNSQVPHVRLEVDRFRVLPRWNDDAGVGKQQEANLHQGKHVCCGDLILVCIRVEPKLHNHDNVMVDEHGYGYGG